MKRFFVITMLFLTVSTVHAVNSDHCLKGCPVGAPDSNDLIKRPIYVLSNNSKYKFADWVAYKVEDSNFGPTKTRNFKPDPDIDPSRTLVEKDYRGAHAQFKYQKGHLAPLASFDGSPHWAQTNYLSNIAPQKAKLNNGQWKVLEAKIRKYTEEWWVPVYVITGTLYEKAMPALPNASQTHRVPSGFWKVIATEEEGQIWATAFIFKQSGTTWPKYCDLWVTIDEIEQRTGLDFFPKLKKSIETEVESGQYDLWYYLGCN